MTPLLELVEVDKTYGSRARRPVHAVAGVSLSVDVGETLTVIGESGSGKSTLARIALGLVAPDSGRVVFEGRALGELSRDERRASRARMTVVFQEPLDALNPRRRVRRIVEDPLRIHNIGESAAARLARVVEVLELVGLGASFLEKYPWELSGGQQQRVGIARALATSPRLVVLDEPTSALDLAVQAQILSLLARLRDELGLAYLFITHDMDVAGYLSDRIAVMFAGRVLELGEAETVLADPRHPYTIDLLSAALSLEPPTAGFVAPPPSAPAELDSASAATEGGEACAYLLRCRLRNDERCFSQRPVLRPVGEGHLVASFCGGAGEAAVGTSDEASAGNASSMQYP